MSIPLFQIFGIHGWEWIIILLIILLLFGARKIPELARNLGRALGEFQRGRLEMEREFKEAVEKLPERRRLEEAAQALGIDPAGKTDEELRELIIKYVRK